MRVPVQSPFQTIRRLLSCAMGGAPFLEAPLWERVSWEQKQSNPFGAAWFEPCAHPGLTLLRDLASLLLLSALLE